MMEGRTVRVGKAFYNAISQPFFDGYRRPTLLQCSCTDHLSLKHGALTAAKDAALKRGAVVGLQASLL